MIVISDTSPLCYLLLIDAIDLLPDLYGCVVIPPSVQAELADPKSPAIVQAWIAHPPNWLNIRTPTLPMTTALDELDAGEQAAIALAQELQADLILLDDQAARTVASKRNLAVVGILGILVRAAQQEKIDFPATINKLQQTNFRASASLIQSLLAQFTSN
jgi:predicted nucleic acid-binding protein